MAAMAANVLDFDADQQAAVEFQWQIHKYNTSLTLFQMALTDFYQNIALYLIRYKTNDVYQQVSPRGKAKTSVPPIGNPISTTELRALQNAAKRSRVMCKKYLQAVNRYFKALEAMNDPADVLADQVFKLVEPGAYLGATIDQKRDLIKTIVEDLKKKKGVLQSMFEHLKTLAAL